jgi:hypothetical protein
MDDDSDDPFADGAMLLGEPVTYSVLLNQSN